MALLFFFGIIIIWINQRQHLEKNKLIQKVLKLTGEEASLPVNVKITEYNIYNPLPNDGN